MSCQLEATLASVKRRSLSVWLKGSQSIRLRLLGLVEYGRFSPFPALIRRSFFVRDQVVSSHRKLRSEAIRRVGRSNPVADLINELALMALRRAWTFGSREMF